MVLTVALRENLRRLLDERGWSAYELAQRSGVQANHIGHVLTGRIRMPRGGTIVSLARALGVGAEVLVEDAASPAGPLHVAERLAPYGVIPHEAKNGDGTGVFAVPLVALDVAAGRPQLRMFPDEPRPYYFRTDFLERKGWTRENPNRFAIYKLGDDTVARSMEDRIASGSLLLVDMQAAKDVFEDRAVWIVNISGVPILKYVTWQPPYLILESHNREPDPDFAPRVLKVASATERAVLLEGRVVWFATEIA